MKRKVFTLGLVLAMAFTALSGCGEKSNSSEPMPSNSSSAEVKEPKEEPEKVEEVKEETNYEEIYSEILDKLYKNAFYGGDYGEEDDSIYGQTGVAETAMYSEGGREDVLSQIGYIIDDISGDDIPELIVGDRMFREYGGTEIFAIYTVVDNKAEAVIDGWGRNRYFLLEDGTMLKEGSSGATESVMLVSEIVPDGTAFIAKEMYFTHANNYDFNDVGVYYNTTGIWDAEKSEKIDISEDDFWNIESEYEERIVDIDFKSFLDYKKIAEPKVSGCFIEDIDLKDHEEFTADTSEYQSQVVIKTDSDVSDFKMQKLTFDCIGFNGRIHFLTEDIYSLDTLKKDKPLLVGMTFYGDTAAYGISYTDENGLERKFTIDMSGEDGSVILNEY